MDTIFALASAPGKAGVAVVRISGDLAWDVAAALGGSVPQPRKAALRTLKDSNDVFLDQALVLVFDAGASFTGEKVAELHLHGSVAVIKAVLSAIGKIVGVRLADPGEFTRRALDNGCMDLAQVEALSDLIESETEAQRKQALQILSGELSERVFEWRQKLVRAGALLEATIDFVDEEVPIDVSDEVKDLLTTVLSSLSSELSGLDVAERVRTGFEVAIVGPPNAGKSTLLNYLAGRDAAITSDIAGTTRDIIEVRMDVSGFPVTFLDTAGLRETQDPVERIGVDLAKQRALAADLRIHLVARGEAPSLEVAKDDLVLIAKCDDFKTESEGVSGKTGFGVQDMLDKITGTLSERVASASLASRERHRVNLDGCARSIEIALDELDSGMEQADLVSEEIRVSARYLETLIGKVDVEHLLDEIFSSFCVGK